GNNFVFDGKLQELCRRFKSELLHEAILVEFHRSRGEMEDGCSLPGRPAFGQELQNLTLSRRQPIRCVLTHARAAEKNMVPLLHNGRRDVSSSRQCSLNRKPQIE